MKAEEDEKYHLGKKLVQASNPKGVKILEKAGKNGNTKALNLLGYCYEEGKSVPYDMAKAFFFYSQAAEGGLDRAQYNAGRCLELGKGVEQNLPLAVELYIKASMQGLEVAQNVLGFCYENGSGIKKDEKEAVRWYSAAANQDNINAQFNLARCIEKGIGVEKPDINTALNLYKQAAEKGHINSQKSIYSIFKQLAANGDTNAMHQVGVCYLSGTGVERDVDTGLKWIKRSQDFQNPKKKPRSPNRPRKKVGKHSSHEELHVTSLSPSSKRKYKSKENSLGFSHKRTLMKPTTIKDIDENDSISQLPSVNLKSSSMSFNNAKEGSEDESLSESKILSKQTAWKKLHIKKAKGHLGFEAIGAPKGAPTYGLSLFKRLQHNPPSINTIKPKEFQKYMIPFMCLLCKYLENNVDTMKSLRSLLDQRKELQSAISWYAMGINSFNHWLPFINANDIKPISKVIDELNNLSLEKPNMNLTYQHPFEPTIIVSNTKVLKEFSSATKPLLIELSADEYKEKSSQLIFKKGDDLKTDMFIMEMFKLFNELWKASGCAFGDHTVQIETYKCLPIGEDAGFIECVPWSKTLAEFEREKDIVGDIDRELLISSAAGSYIGAYIFRTRDRHHDNILISGSKVFHIDFGFVLGDAPGFDANEFAITTGLHKIMKEGNNWGDFRILCVNAFGVLRDHRASIVEYAKNIFDCVFPKKKDLNLEEFLNERFMIHKDYKEILLKKLGNAPKSKQLYWKNIVHSVVQSVKQ